MRRWIIIGVLALATMFCSVNLSDPPTPTPDIAAMVDATLTAFAAGQVVPTATQTQAVVPPTATLTPAPLPAGPTATETLSTTPMSSFPEMGTIAGTLMYPSSGIPALRIVAFPLDGSAPSFTDLAAGQSTYTFDLPVGTYHVVAYRLSGGVGGGGYTQMVPCGLQYGCDDHSLITVTVTAGATTYGVDPNDWYAPDGSFPPMPVP